MFIPFINYMMESVLPLCYNNSRKRNTADKGGAIMSTKEDQFYYKSYRSGELTNGIERAAHRALLYSTGLDEKDLKKPMVAVVNSFTEMVWSKLPSINAFRVEA